MGGLSATDLLTIAESQGLKMSRMNFERITGKPVFAMKTRKEIIPFSEVRKSIGQATPEFWQKTDVKRLRIGKESYVTPNEAERIKTSYLEAKEIKKQIAKQRLEKLRAEQQQKQKELRAEQQQIKMKKRIKKQMAKQKQQKLKSKQQRIKKREERTAKKKVKKKKKKKVRKKRFVEKGNKGVEKRKLIARYRKIILYEDIPAQRKVLMEKLLSQSTHLTLEEFETKVVPALNRLMER